MAMNGLLYMHGHLIADHINPVSKYVRMCNATSSIVELS